MEYLAPFWTPPPAASRRSLRSGRDPLSIPQRLSTFTHVSSKDSPRKDERLFKKVFGLLQAPNERLVLQIDGGSQTRSDPEG